MSKKKIALKPAPTQDATIPLSAITITWPESAYGYESGEETISLSGEKLARLCAWEPVDLVQEGGR